MDKSSRVRHWVSWALGLTAGTSPAWAGFVQNPSFESNFNETWPHYSSIDLWEGGSGVNEAAGPFHNTGTAVPDQARVGFKQGAGTLGQEISGLTVGQQYWVQFYYDARIGSQKVDITVTFNDVTVGKIANVQPAINKNQPYYFASFPFTPEVDAGKLLFTMAVTGDSTALFDGVNIVPRDEGNLLVVNPSFEASGDLPDDGSATAAIAGWQGTGAFGINKTDGSGAYANNGTAPDQDHVAFLKGGGSLAQVVSGLQPGKAYRVSFAYNAQTGTTPHLQLKAGDQVLLDENVTAVGGTTAYRTKTATFTAADFSANLVFSQTGAASTVLLLDDVRVLGETAQALPPLGISPTVAEISPGQKVTVTVSVPAELLAARAADLKFRSLVPTVARLTGADANGVVTLHFDKNGATAKTLEVEGLARGSATLDVVDSATLAVTDTLTAWVVNSFIKNASFESEAAPAGDGTGVILGWTGGSGVNTVGGKYFDNGTVPDRTQVAFVQGAKTLSQTVTGLTPGETYWLQFAYNSALSGSAPSLVVRFAGQQLVSIASIQPVGEGAAFYFTNLVFKPTQSSGLLEFVTSGTGTLLLDAVNVAQRDAGDIVVWNPSFEASGTIVPGVGYLQPAPVAGWSFQGAGMGVNVTGRDPFADNGVNPDQDAVLFMQNAGAVSQTIGGLTPNRKYTVLLWANLRNAGATPAESTLRVSFDDNPVLEELIPPVGGQNPYVVKQAVFTASATEGVLKLEHAAGEGDHSLLLDNLRIFPEGQIPPMVTTQPAASAIVFRGENLTLTVEAMGAAPLSYQWQLNGVDLPGKTAATLTLSSVAPNQSGQYRAVVKNNYGTKASQPATVTVYEKIAGAFNTGVTGQGGFVGPGEVDPHYTLVENPSNTNSTKAYVIASPVVTWVPNPDSAQWIGPAANPEAEPLAAIGFYTYRLTFDLTGYDPANSVIVGSTAADQGMHDIYLNGKVVADYRLFGAPGSLHPFSLLTGFKAGLNTLDFTVGNIEGPRPTGLLVTGLTIGSQVPSTPSTVALTIIRQAGQVKLSWPSAAAGYVLQSATQPAGAWGNDTAATSTESDRTVVVVNASGAARFYRLIKP